MGFYPVCPGDGQYAIGSPLFPKITLQLPAPYNKKVTITAEGVAEGNKYIESLSMDGKSITKPFINHADLVACDNLVFEMSATPTDWGKD
ncbi:MAG: glycoside hydrolase family 92 protein [Bacteroidetes bacterium]|nr:glycoside hydrolase family 92 protein [Bacteroidota bacterium]